MTAPSARSSRIRFAGWISRLLLVVGCGFGWAADAGAEPLSAETRARMSTSGIVGSDIVAALEGQETVRVMIAFTPADESGPLTLDARTRRAAVDAVGQAIVARAGADELTAVRRFTSVNALAGEITAAGVLNLLADPHVLRIDADLGGSGNLAEAVPLARIDDVQALGFTGDGVTVAVLDSGYDTDHPDLADDLVAEQCFCSGGTGCCPNGSSTQTGAGAAEDDHGHGTNVSGIITSRGTVAPLGGAPDAGIVAIKVLDSTNSFCCASDVVAGLDWIINNRPDVDLVNMSLGTSQLFAGTCDGASATTMAFATAIDTLRTNGVAVFVSAGNEGSGTMMGAPACIANSIAVGAVWDSNVGSQTVLGCTDATTQADQVTCFSNSDAATDLFAPGAPTTSTGMGGGTSTFFGTSQASPLTAACAADLLERDPTMTPAAIEAALESSAVSVTDATNGLSFPRLDCFAALDLTADLAVQKSALTDPVTPGGSVVFEIQVTNAGPDVAADTVVTDVLPSAVTYVSDTDACVEGPPGTLTCHLGNIAANGSVTFTITGQVDADLVAPACEPFSITNTASVASGSVDPNLDDNEDSTDVGVRFSLNHFQCYEVDRELPSRRPSVDLDDAFGPGHVNVRRLKRFCAPADKNGEDPTAPLEPCHLTGYEISQAPPFQTVGRYTFRNQFGAITLDVGRPQMILVPTAKSKTAPPTLVDPTLDHFKCHQVRQAHFRRSGLDVVDQIGTLVDDIKRPVTLCSPANKNGGGIIDPGVHLLCYEVRTRPRRPAFSGPFFIANQFDDTDIDLTRPTELCVPSVLDTGD